MTENEFITECRERLERAKEGLGHLREKELALRSKIEGLEKILRGSAPAGSANGTVNQSKLVRDRVALGDGVTPKELRRLYEEKTGRKPSKNFPYTHLYDLKKKGKAVVREEKYYPATPETTEST